MSQAFIAVAMPRIYATWLNKTARCYYAIDAGAGREGHYAIHTESLHCDAIYAAIAAHVVSPHVFTQTDGYHADTPLSAMPPAAIRHIE